MWKDTRKIIALAHSYRIVSPIRQQQLSDYQQYNPHSKRTQNASIHLNYPAKVEKNLIQIRYKRFFFQPFNTHLLFLLTMISFFVLE